MVVILVIAILIAIAIPTFLGSREKATNRVAQTHVRYALTAERTYFADALAFTDDVNQLRIEVSDVMYLQNDASEDYEEVSVFLSGPGGSEVILGSRSGTGTCWYIKETADAGTQYAELAGAACPADADSVPVVWASSW